MAVGEDQAIGGHDEARAHAGGLVALEHADMDNGGACRFDRTDDGAGIGILQLGFVICVSWGAAAPLSSSIGELLRHHMGRR